MRVALAIVRCAAALLPDPVRRARYREQWEADVIGAAELHLSALRLAVGAAGAAVLITVTSTKGTRMPPIGPLALAMHLAGGNVRRRVAAVAALSALTLLGGLFLLVTG